MKNKTEILLALIRLGIGHSSVFQIEIVDWSSIHAIAEEQGLSAIILDGIVKLPEQQRPPKVFLLQWIGETLQGYEYRYELYQRTIAEMAGFYNSHGFKMMVLKGYACSLDWPKPEHRPCGDIDIWLFGQQKEADTTLGKEKGVVIDKSHHHHTVFEWDEFMLENHYDLVNVHHHRINVELENELKRLADDDSHFVGVNGEKVYLPSPNLHALFLLKHTMNDFTTSSMTLRQLLDWAFHVEKHGEEIDWEWLELVLDKYHMRDFYNCINTICVEDLGFAPQIFHGVQFNPQLKDMVLKDTIYPGFARSEPHGIIARFYYKCKRWKGNAWKHYMCYEESRWVGFWTLLRSHIINPKI